MTNKINTSNVYHFADHGNACVINETNTPRHWYNYLWNENRYCAQISQTGHGRSYYLSEKAEMCMINQQDARYIYPKERKISMKLYDLFIEHRNTPIGLSVAQPHFSWKIQSSSNNTKRSAYAIIVKAVSNDIV